MNQYVFFRQEYQLSSMLKSLLSLVTPGNKEKKKLAVAGSPVSASRQTDVSFVSETDVSVMNDTSVTIPLYVN